MISVVGTLLELSIGQSRLIVKGPEPNLGNHATSLRVETALEELEIAVFGKSVSIVDGVVQLDRPVLMEHARYEIYLRGPYPRIVETAPGLPAINLDYSSEDLSHYSLNFGSAVGDVVWKWLIPSGWILFRLEVFPTKLDYREDFARIKTDIRRVSEILIADITGVTGAGFASSDGVQEAKIEWLEQIRREATNLRVSMMELIPKLRPQVRDIETVVAIDRLRGRQPIRRRDAGLLSLGMAPTSIAIRDRTVSDATKLNGHLKWEVDRLLLTGAQIRDSDLFQSAPLSVQSVVGAALEEARVWSKRLAGIPTVPYLPHLQTRLRDPLYNRAFTSLRRLRLALHEQESPELLGLKDLWLLYEYWVYLRSVEELKSRFPTIVGASGSLVKEVGGQLYLKRGVESRIVLQDKAGNRVVATYNRLFVGLPTINQMPDMTIENVASAAILVVDAKYRMGRTPEYVKRYGMPGPEEDDINVIHRYRDAIVDVHSNKKLVTAGLVAFPGSDPESFRHHHFFQSWKEVRVGAIPMLPGKTALLSEAILDVFPAAMQGGPAAA